jgi:hypothetical protein
MAQRAVYKSTAAEFLDDLFGGTGDDLARAYERSLELLSDLGSTPLSKAAARMVEDGGLAPDAVEDSSKGWRAGRDVDLAIGHAYRQAIELARGRKEPVPIETLWITGAGGDFEVHVCEGKRQVTVVMFIPVDRSYGSQRAQARTWVVRAGSDRDPADARLTEDGDPSVVMVQVSGPQSA